MSLVNKVIQQLVVAINGAFIGAMVLIGLVLVPFWQSVPPVQFLDWFTQFSPVIGNIMIPLGPGVLMLSLATCFLSKNNRVLWAATSVLVLINVLYFPIYYLPMNAAFATQSIDVAAVAAELANWESYHWQRVLFATAGLCTSIAALVYRQPEQ